MPLYLSDGEPVFFALQKYRKAKEELLRAEVQRDLPAPELVAAFKDATLALAETVDKDARV